jgi:hypothetical protein
MSGYISSNNNRFYASIESAYGQAAPVMAENRFPAVHLTMQQALQSGVRRDKTGSRTSLAPPTNLRKHTAFQLQTYLTSWDNSGTPVQGALFQAAMGGVPTVAEGLAVASNANALIIQTVLPHGLAVGNAISFSGEIRFVTAVVDGNTIQLNAPFASGLANGAALGTTASYSLASALQSLTIYDYWDPVDAVDRVLAGAAVDAFEFSVNGDFHEFIFQGPASDVIDSASFIAGQAGLASFPVEPAVGAYDYSVVPGHLGQVWLGSPANQFFTLTAAQVRVSNNVATRNQEYGAITPRGLAPGPRQVISHFSLFAQDDAQTQSLYQVARAASSVPAMIQLGSQQSQMMAIFLPNVMPTVPVFNDGETRLQWEFQGCQAFGSQDDELYVAFA